MIMSGLGVVYMNYDEEYRNSVTPTDMNPIWKCDQSMIGVLYYIGEYVRASYDVMWLCAVYCPQFCIYLYDLRLMNFVHVLWSLEGGFLNTMC